MVVVGGVVLPLTPPPSAVCRFIILACDGLFKVFSADEAVKFVLGVLQVLLSSASKAQVVMTSSLHLMTS